MGACFRAPGLGCVVRGAFCRGGSEWRHPHSVPAPCLLLACLPGVPGPLLGAGLSPGLLSQGYMLGPLFPFTGLSPWLVRGWSRQTLGLLQPYRLFPGTVQLPLEERV